MVLLISILILPNTNLFAEQKNLSPEEVLRLKNYELSLKNMRLEIELLSREMQERENERNTYIEGLYQSYNLNSDWKIDLSKEVWFLQNALQPN